MDRNDYFLNPHEQPENECIVCGKPMDYWYSKSNTCSNDCFKASLI